MLSCLHVNSFLRYQFLAMKSDWKRAVISNYVELNGKFDTFRETSKLARALQVCNHSAFMSGSAPAVSRSRHVGPVTCTQQQLGYAVLLQA